MSNVQSGTPSNFRETAFGARKIDIEDVLNTLINEINLAPKAANEHGDMRRVNAVMEGYVLNLDAVVYNVLRDNKNREFIEYETRRGNIFKKWPKDDEAAPGSLVRELFGLCIYAVRMQKLFKMRKTLFFSEGWENDRKLAMERMDAEADKDSLDQESADIESVDTTPTQ